MNPRRINYSEWMESLKACRNYDGSVSGFWNLLANTLSALDPSSKVRILAHSQSNWRVLAVSPEGYGGSPLLTRESLEELSTTARREGIAQMPSSGRVAGQLLLICLDSNEPNLDIFIEWSINTEEIVVDDEFQFLISFLKELPAEFNERLKQRRVERQLNDYSRALEVLASVNAHRKFIPAAMALVNEVANRFDATRVCLGWVEGYYVKSCAMSGTERFERKVEIVQRLEAAMEECRDQEEEVLFPQVDGIDTIVRSHEAYAQDAHISSVVSIPLRFDGEVCAVLTLEKEQDLFTIEDLQSLRVIADQVTPVLFDLKKANRWFGKRWADSARETLSKTFGPRHTWMKVGVVSLSLFLIFALFFPYTYRVKANFIVNPDSLALIPVPFNGYIEQVNYRPGDEVAAGNILIQMDEGELLVEKARALADLKRFRAEAELAEAEGNMGEFRVANELAGQAEARLQLAEYRLERAEIRAPFDGVLVEGDLRERLGSPVDQGEVLMKFSRLDGLYLEIELPERDIDLLDGSNQGEVAFASRPDLKFKAVIERIEPSAMAGEGENFFIVRAELVNESADWLRPGMTGVARLDAGKKTLAWRATHRVIDFFRIFFWI